MNNPAQATPPAGPSPLYRTGPWRLALLLPRYLPRAVLEGLCAGVAAASAWFQPARRAIVAANLAPLLEGDRRSARSAAGRNYAEFGRKLAALWRFEAGLSMDGTARDGSGWEHFSTALAAGRGVLLVTPHLGNWELGAPLLTRRGVRPLVLTAPEPGQGFTELRSNARARHGIDTLVVGNDPFAFVEVIRRLQAGGVVALLLDRPTKGTSVSVELCGRPFDASVAAAELARATGCAIVPVVLPREGRNWVAHGLAPVPYERRSLTQPAARRELTARILAALEPWIRRHPEQWFHFVPVWPAAPAKKAESDDPPVSRKTS